MSPSLIVLEPRRKKDLAGQFSWVPSLMQMNELRDRLYGEVSSKNLASGTPQIAGIFEHAQQFIPLFGVLAVNDHSRMKHQFYFLLFTKNLPVCGSQAAAAMAEP